MKLKFPSQQLDNINLKIRIESLRSYINIVKNGISQSKKIEKDKINNRSEKVKDEFDLHELRTSEQIFDLEYVSYFEGNFECSQIENTATYSIITSCYMLLETNMVVFTNIAKKHFFLDLKYNKGVEK